MKIKIKVGDKWISVPVIDAKKYPLIKIVHDPTLPGFRALLESNEKISLLRIDGQEGRYGIDFNDSPFFLPEEIAFSWLSICKAQQIPKGAKITFL